MCSIRMLMLALMLASIIPAAAATGAEPSVSTKATPVSEFLDSLGIVIHAGYTDGAYAKVGEAIEDLNYLGIHQLRDGTPDPSGGIPFRNQRAAITSLVKAGNKFVFIVFAGQPIAVSLGQIAEIEDAHPGAVIAIEGPNEINNAPVRYSGLTGEAAARAFQRDLYAAVKAHAILGHLPVYYFTGGSKIDLQKNKGLADYANAHPYPYRGEAPGPRIANEFKSLFTMPTPRVITETGYYNRPQNPFGSGVDDSTQAKLTLDLLFSAFAQGVSKTYLYQLRAAYADPKGTNMDAHYGLFNLNNSPKPAAVALHNLTTILATDAAPAENFVPDTLAYTLTGLPPNANSLLLQREPGRYILAVWAEPVIWDEKTHAPVASPTTSVTVRLGTMTKSVPAATAARNCDTPRRRSSLKRLCPFPHCRQRYERNLRRVHASRFASTRGVWQKPK
jgi:hypothetical protein